MTQNIPTRFIKKVAAFVVRVNSPGHPEFLAHHFGEQTDLPCRIPGGGVEANEEPAEAIVREIHEESGLTNLTLVRKLGVQKYFKPFLQVNIERHDYLFLAPAETLDGWQTVVAGKGDDLNEVFVYRWFNPDTLAAIDEEFRSFINSTYLPELFTRPSATTEPAVTIRRATPDDYLAFHRILSDPKVIWGTLQLPYSSPEIWRKRLAEPIEGMYHLLACVAEDVVGEISLETFPQRPRRKHVGAVGMAVRVDWQGRGIGSALLQAAVDLSDNWLNLLRLELEVFTDNEAAVHLYKKFGFEVEGVKKLYAFRGGQYVDVYAMARLR